ncbi:zwei Ig domain protein zig-8-like [Penaeus chinensis]|uniref:zwei Ig domain protein zig-8-like n=1 Tax=Penaeus chinensis TaxID=139456 RepID=UPI001FB5BFC1|nr:zwei Ig domain protein zig-8-like [Penaeus chinensis]
MELYYYRSLAISSIFNPHAPNPRFPTGSPKIVSWVRHRDIHVLTVGRFTFTNDDRFEAHHEDGSNEWVLKLRFPTTNDSGIYECQINTKPTRTQLISLDVVGFILHVYTHYAKYK